MAGPAEVPGPLALPRGLVRGGAETEDRSIKWQPQISLVDHARTSCSDTNAAVVIVYSIFLLLPRSLPPSRAHQLCTFAGRQTRQPRRETGRGCCVQRVPWGWLVASYQPQQVAYKKPSAGATLSAATGRLLLGLGSRKQQRARLGLWSTAILLPEPRRLVRRSMSTGMHVPAPASLASSGAFLMMSRQKQASKEWSAPPQSQNTPLVLTCRGGAS